MNIDLPLLIKQAVEKSEILFKEKRLKETEIVLKQLLVVDPENQKGLQLLGLVHYGRGQYPEAINLFKKTLALNDNPENHNNIALCYAWSFDPEEALKHILKAIELDPKNASYYNNLNLIYRSNAKMDLALEASKKAMELNDKDPTIWLNMGSTYGHLKNMPLAVECLEKASQLDPANDATHVDLAYAYHLSERWSDAWPHYEYRLRYFPQARYFDQFYDPAKRWDGSNICGKKLVIYCEQGAGDFIQFLRFVPRVENSGVKVVLQAPKEMISMLGHYDVTAEPVKEYDYHCSIMSLTALCQIPNEQLGGKEYHGYLSSNKYYDMKSYDGFKKIGVVWAGNPQHPNDAHRSVPAIMFKEISQLPNVKLFSLQVDLRKRAYSNKSGIIDLAEGCSEMKMVDMSPFIKDFSDTAAILNSLDLLISVDTAALHLAGAMNKPCLGLISYNPDWRWGLDGDRTMWYPSVRLIRQQKYGDWSGVFNKLTDLIGSMSALDFEG